MTSSQEIQPPSLALLPGYELPVNFTPRGEDDPKKRLFATALDADLCDRDCELRLPLITLREISMLRFMNVVTDKLDWHIKVFDETINQKWKTEILEQPNADFTIEMANYCIEELKHKAELYKTSGFVRIHHGDVVKSDNVIPSELKEALKLAVASLENVPEKLKDWHPGSNQMVLDLVHPSLFPLIYGRSQILETETTDLENCIAFCGRGKVIPVPPKGDTEVELTDYVRDKMYAAYSQKFQWLPCNVDISGEIPKIVSYINNLHPQQHTELYGVLEKIIDYVIPLWSASLGPLRDMNYQVRFTFGPEVSYGELVEYVEKEGPKQLDDEDDDDFYERKRDWLNDNKGAFLVRPNPGVFSPQEEKIVDLKKEYGQTGLQVIVKLANIHLTPEKPEYGGGSWHVEGQMNEHICATAIYYYNNENVTPSQLAFRQASNIDEAELGIHYEQDDHIWLPLIYGFNNEEAPIQNVGSIHSREGRVVTFPNILQHQVQPFKLEDSTKPGHRKILALFLVDPNIKIISTANIPCQQQQWWTGEVKPAMRGLPFELRDCIIDEVGDFPIRLDEAKKLREELMEERKEYLISYQEKIFLNATISLCEH